MTEQTNEPITYATCAGCGNTTRYQPTLGQVEDPLCPTCTEHPENRFLLTGVLPPKRKRTRARKTTAK
jgi:hypothetical protein